MRSATPRSSWVSLLLNLVKHRRAISLDVLAADRFGHLLKTVKKRIPAATYYPFATASCGCGFFFPLCSLSWGPPLRAVIGYRSWRSQSANNGMICAPPALLLCMAICLHARAGGPE